MIDLEAIKQRREAAQQMVSDLCHGKREWVMRIPAQPDYDPDLVIAASLGDNTKLVAEIERLQCIEQAACAVLAPFDRCIDELESHVASEFSGTIYYEDHMEPAQSARAAHDALRQALEGE